MGWPGWVRNALHLETLFVMCAVVISIYFTWKYRSVTKGVKQLDKFVGQIIHVPGNLIKKKPKRIYKHQERCREIFQSIFRAEFKSVRPKWLINPATNNPLELDGFNSRIATPIGRGIAFEYDGAQHSKYVKRFHPNGPIDLKYQMAKDRVKTFMCKQHGILLIRIPHFVHYDDLERYIKVLLSREGMGRYL